VVTTVYLGLIGKAKLLVLSDLHIGDPRQHPTVLAVLRGLVSSESPDYLVLAGDVLEGNLADEAQIASLRATCRQASARIILRGNHDRQETADLAVSLGCVYGTELQGRSGVADFAIEHGDRFDTTWRLFPWAGWIGIYLNRCCYRLLRWDPQTTSRRWAWVQRGLRRQHEKAWAAWQGKAIVVSGHTHLPTNQSCGVGYFNSGDWLTHRSYVVVQDGVAATKEISL
jgi:predicted phosphodiesterase